MDISLLGSDVMFRPQRISYKVTADPGSYVTVILISPRGTRTLLDPAAISIDGAKRGALYREARTGNDPGESYLVAIATRNKFHSANLVRQARNSYRFASKYYSAEASLDDLLAVLLPTAGNDFSAAFIPFRLLSSGFPETLAYARNCYPSPALQSRAVFADDFYDQSVFESPFYDDLGALNPFAYSQFASYANAGCGNSRIVLPILLAHVPVIPVPIRPRDTAAVAIDSVPNPARGNGPIAHPVAPRPLDVRPFTVETARPTPLEARPAIPVSRPVPLEENVREPIAPRTDPVVRIERERPTPISEPPVPIERSAPTPPMPVSQPSVPLSQPPVPRERPDPTPPPVGMRP